MIIRINFPSVILRFASLEDDAVEEGSDKTRPLRILAVSVDASEVEIHIGDNTPKKECVPTIGM